MYFLGGGLVLPFQTVFVQKPKEVSTLVPSLKSVIPHETHSILQLVASLVKRCPKVG